MLAREVNPLAQPPGLGVQGRADGGTQRGSDCLTLLLMFGSLYVFLPVFLGVAWLYVESWPGETVDRLVRNWGGIWAARFLAVAPLPVWFVLCCVLVAWWRRKREGS
jgi:hypothetical protein